MILSLNGSAPGVAGRLGIVFVVKEFLINPPISLNMRRGIVVRSVMPRDLCG